MASGNRKTTGKTNKAGDKRGTLSTATQFKEGQSGNPNGRKKGQRNFATIYREALVKIAATKGLEPDDIELALAAKALEKALKGDFKFYQDIQDRIHGKPVQTNLNKTIDDVELDESEIETMDAMLAKFMKVKDGGTIKVVKKKAAKKPATV
jgi:hypothetical protein